MSRRALYSSSEVSYVLAKPCIANASGGHDVAFSSRTFGSAPASRSVLTLVVRSAEIASVSGKTWPMISASPATTCTKSCGEAGVEGCEGDAGDEGGGGGRVATGSRRTVG